MKKEILQNIEQLENGNHLEKNEIIELDKYIKKLSFEMENRKKQVGLDSEEKVEEKYLLWKDYGCEGWSYVDCDNLDDLKSEIKNLYGKDYMITKQVKVNLIF